MLVGYGQSVASMREWGLFVSKGITDGEPAEFGEPGLFLVRPDSTVYAAVLNTMPFGRPHLDDAVTVDLQSGRISSLTRFRVHDPTSNVERRDGG